MSEHDSQCDVYDFDPAFSLGSSKPCNCNRRAVLLRVAGEIDLESYHHARNEGARKRLVDMAAKYRREAKDGA